MARARGGVSGEVNPWGPARAAGSAGRRTHLWGGCGGGVAVLTTPLRVSSGCCGIEQARPACARRFVTRSHKPPQGFAERGPFFEGLLLVGLCGNGSRLPALPPLPLHFPLVSSHAASGGHAGCSRHYPHYGAVGRPRLGCAPGRRPLPWGLYPLAVGSVVLVSRTVGGCGPARRVRRD